MAAASSLSTDELTRDFGTADRSVLGTLVHVYAADRAWLGRVRNNPPAVFMDPNKDMHPEVLRNDWPRVHREWRDWVDGLTDESPGTWLAYRDLKGKAHETPVWQIVLHGGHRTPELTSPPFPDSTPSEREHRNR